MASRVDAMKWPWVSRLAYELLLDERDRLRTQNDELIDHRRRLERTSAGMRERPSDQKRPRDRSDTVPQVLRDLIAGYASPATRAVIYDEVRGAFAEGQDWDEITDRIQAHLVESRGGREDGEE